MGTSNPFDDILGAIATVANRVEEIARTLQRPKVDWEPIKTAAATRSKATRTLLAAVEDGRVRSKRVACPGGKEMWLLNVNDLDQHFPVVTPKK